jgi:AbrB family looped-hinge helix DNA binding protein
MECHVPESVGKRWANVTIHTRVDRFGRIVIPKVARDALGLAPGTPVTLEDVELGLLVKPGTAAPVVRSKGNVLVFSGKASEEAGKVLRTIREDRIRRHFPRRTR